MRKKVIVISHLMFALLKVEAIIGKTEEAMTDFEKVKRLLRADVIFYPF